MLRHRIMHLVISPFLAATAASFPLPSVAAAQDRYEGPIIDMHLHARGEVQADRRFCFPDPCEGAPTIAKDVAEMKAMLREAMDDNNIVLGVISDENPDVVLDWMEGQENRFLGGVSEPSRFSKRQLKEFYVKGSFKVVGEMGEQYLNIAIDDPSLDHVFAFAHEHDLPILIHLEGIGGDAGFPANLGDPLRLAPVLRKYPGLRVYLENAGWPFLEEITSLMYVYPSVYADVSTILHLTPRDQALRYLKGLVDNGLGKRIMYGSDQMSWPEVIPVVIEAIQSAEFLTVEQKADIFYNNAARFLRLPNEEIARHQATSPRVQ